jgi:hypothetical protein
LLRHNHLQGDHDWEIICSQEKEEEVVRFQADQNLTLFSRNARNGQTQDILFGTLHPQTLDPSEEDDPGTPATPAPPLYRNNIPEDSDLYPKGIFNLVM